MACCIGGVILSVAFFGGAALIGYPDLVVQASVLSTLVLAINVSIPMVAWMRFRHHEWRPTLEMGAATMGLGIILAAAGLLGLIPVSDVFGSKVLLLWSLRSSSLTLIRRTIYRSWLSDKEQVGK
jgi:hypothetical protein